MTTDPLPDCPCGDPSNNRYASNDPGRRCRGPGCREAHRRYERDRLRRTRYDTRPIRIHVPSDEARAHMEWLRQRGIGVRRMQVVTGIGYRHLQCVAQGLYPTITTTTADKILAVNLSHRIWVPATEARRHLNALHRAGHTWVSIGEGVGMNHEVLRQMARGRPKRTTPEKLERILAYRPGMRDRRTRERVDVAA